MGAEEDNRRATETVKAILNDPAINGIDFMEGDTSVSKSIYQKVLQAIDGGDIAVLVLPNLLPPAYAAMFFPALDLKEKKMEFYNVIILRKPDLGSKIGEQFEEAMAIVHECTHAGFSAILALKMSHLKHEACAYVAQFIFGITKMLALRGDPTKVNYKEPIEAAAWAIAMLDNKSKTATGREAAYYTRPEFAVTWREAWNKLYAAIAVNAEYAPSAKDDVKNVELGRQWKLPAK
jgi:hypothetical protein